MRVIFNEDVKGVAKKGEIKEISDGYARNFLLPKNKAVEANDKNMSILKNKEEAEKHKKDVELEQAKIMAKKMDGMTVEFLSKVGDNGKLFGAITAKHIEDILKEKFDLKVDKKKISLNDSIKELGIHEVNIKLYEGIVTKIKVNVMKAV